MKLLDELKYNSDGLIPAIIQDASDGQVLVLCYMNRDALEATVKTGKVHLFRRSLGRLMIKGETSGHVQTVRGVRVDCEGKSLLIKVDQKVGACHTGHFTCYFTKYNPQTDTTETIGEKVFEPGDVY